MWGSSARRRQNPERPRNSACCGISRNAAPGLITRGEASMSDALNPTFSYGMHKVRVVFGAGALTTLPGELDRSGMRRVLLLTTPGRAAERDAFAALLEGRLAERFDGARTHVPQDVARDAGAVVARARPDALLALGGGSAIGLGKALAIETGLPLAAIPTTYSGSEMT